MISEGLDGLDHFRNPVDGGPDDRDREELFEVCCCVDVGRGRRSRLLVVVLRGQQSEAAENLLVLTLGERCLEFGALIRHPIRQSPKSQSDECGGDLPPEFWGTNAII